LPAGETAQSIAIMNQLDLTTRLPAGTRIKLPG
jgi:hypothetical protein